MIVGGQYGEGALLVNDKTVGYYTIVAASYGLQAGAQTFGYAMFLMNDSALAYLKNPDKEPDNIPENGNCSGSTGCMRFLRLVSPILQAAEMYPFSGASAPREEAVTGSRSHHDAKLPLQDLKLPAIPGSQARSV